MASGFDYKDVLQTNRKKLVEDFDAKALILDDLFGKKVINRKDYDDILAEKTLIDRNRCLLDKIERKGEKAYYVFLGSVQIEFPNLYDLLNNGEDVSKREQRK